MPTVGHNNYALTCYTPAIDFQGIWQPWNLIRLINKGVDLLHVNMLSDTGSLKLCEHERELLIIVEFYASMQGCLPQPKGDPNKDSMHFNYTTNAWQYHD